MFVHRTQVTDTVQVSAAEQLHHLVVLGAHLVLQLCGGLDQLVLLENRSLVVRLEVSLTVRGHTLKTGHDSFLLPPCTEITGHISRSSRRSSSEARVPHLLHEFCQHDVFLQSRPWGEGLSALGTAVDSPGILLVPGALKGGLDS